MTPWQLHRQKWLNCTRCPLHEGRKKVVLVRGKLPCEVLFIGEAPGMSEDSLGEPFKGPAGGLLDALIDSAVELSGKEAPRMAFTNLVGCIPLAEGEGGKKVPEPSKESIKACAPRLDELARIAKPKVVVFVGNLSAKYAKRLGEGRAVGYEIKHPSAILRADVTIKGMDMQRVVVTLSEVFEDL